MFDVYHRTAPGYLANLCSRRDDHQHTAISLHDEQGHTLPTARLLLQDLLHGTHFRLLFEKLTHMLLSVVDLRLICFPYRTNSLRVG